MISILFVILVPLYLRTKTLCDEEKGKSVIGGRVMNVCWWHSISGEIRQRCELTSKYCKNAFSLSSSSKLNWEIPSKMKLTLNFRWGTASFGTNFKIQLRCVLLSFFFKKQVLRSSIQKYSCLSISGEIWQPPNNFKIQIMKYGWFWISYMRSSNINWTLKWSETLSLLFFSFEIEATACF